MTLRFLETARAELREAFDWYEQQRSGLGGEFSREVAAAIDDIVEMPLAWALVNASIRKRRAGRFPYGIFYVVEDGQIVILSVMHLHRDPVRWEDMS